MCTFVIKWYKICGDVSRQGASCRLEGIVNSFGETLSLNDHSLGDAFEVGTVETGS